MDEPRGFFAPDRKKLAVFFFFVLLMAAGKGQAWVFTKAGPKPFLYDLLAPIPFWPIWMYLLIPLGLLAMPLRWLGVDIFRGWLFVITNLLYFYLLSCVLVWLFAALRRKLKPVKQL